MWRELSGFSSFHPSLIERAKRKNYGRGSLDQAYPLSREDEIRVGDPVLPGNAWILEGVAGPSISRTAFRARKRGTTLSYVLIPIGHTYLAKVQPRMASTCCGT